MELDNYFSVLSVELNEQIVLYLDDESVKVILDLFPSWESQNLYHNLVKIKFAGLYPLVSTVARNKNWKDVYTELIENVPEVFMCYSPETGKRDDNYRRENLQAYMITSGLHQGSSIIYKALLKQDFIDVYDKVKDFNLKCNADEYLLLFFTVIRDEPEQIYAGHHHISLFTRNISNRDDFEDIMSILLTVKCFGEYLDSMYSRLDFQRYRFTDEDAIFFGWLLSRYKPKHYVDMHGYLVDIISNKSLKTLRITIKYMIKENVIMENISVCIDALLYYLDERVKDGVLSRLFYEEIIKLERHSRKHKELPFQ